MSIRISDLTEESLRRYLPAKYRELPLHIFDVLDSTNTRAKQMALDGAIHGTVVLAHQQTDGRGRLGRSFFSPREGIYLSMILRAGSGDGAAAIDPPTLVTAAAAVAVAESIEAVCEKSAGIKWVNDVYVDGKKVCGILTEGITDFETGQLESLVVGIGVNTTLTEFPPALLEIAGALEGDYAKSALTASIITKLLDFAEELVGRGDAPLEATAPNFIKTYREKSIVLGKTVTVYKGSYRADPQRELTGRAARVLDIDDIGGLCVLYTDGTREALTSGEISIRL